MAYDYSPKQLELWDWPAMATTYRLKYLNEARNAAYWKARAEHAEASNKETAA